MPSIDDWLNGLGLGKYSRGRGGQKGGPAKIKTDDIAALKAHGVGGSEIGSASGEQAFGAFHFLQRVEAMSPKVLLARLPVDPYIVAIVGMVCLASLLPAYGSGAIVVRYATNAAIALLFFLHGAWLSPQAAFAGASHWRLHIVVLVSTFVLFPALGLGAKALFPGLLTPPLWTGVILPLRIAFDSPIVDRLYLDRWRQRPGRAQRRDRIQPLGHGIDAAAGRAAARRAGWLLGAWRRRHRPPASAALRRGSACSAVDRPRTQAKPSEASFRRAAINPGNC